MLLLSSANFFQNIFFQKILSGTLTECHKVWTEIWTDVSVPVRVQTVCNHYQQTTKVSTSKERLLTHKVPPTICSRWNFKILLLFSKLQIRHDASWELSAGRQFSRIIIPYFFSKIRKDFPKCVFCCSRDWGFRGWTSNYLICYCFF